MKVHLQVSPLSTWKRTQREGYSSRGLHTIEPIQYWYNAELVKAGLSPSMDSHSTGPQSPPPLFSELGTLESSHHEDPVKGGSGPLSGLGGFMNGT